MLLLGLGAVKGGFSYDVGSLEHMGPGFFPAAVGTLMAITGVLIALSALVRSKEGDVVDKSEGPSIHPEAFPDIRGAVCIILSLVAFIIVGQYGGLLPATFAVVFIAALGDRTNTLLQALLLSVAMCVVAVVVFWWALQLQLPLFQWG